MRARYPSVRSAQHDSPEKTPECAVAETDLVIALVTQKLPPLLPPPLVTIAIGTAVTPEVVVVSGTSTFGTTSQVRENGACGQSAVPNCDAETTIAVDVVERKLWGAQEEEKASC